MNSLATFSFHLQPDPQIFPIPFQQQLQPHKAEILHTVTMHIYIYIKCNLSAISGVIKN